MLQQYADILLQTLKAGPNVVKKVAIKNYIALTMQIPN